MTENANRRAIEVAGALARVFSSFALPTVPKVLSPTERQSLITEAQKLRKELVHG